MVSFGFKHQVCDLVFPLVLARYKKAFFVFSLFEQVLASSDQEAPETPRATRSGCVLSPEAVQDDHHAKKKAHRNNPRRCHDLARQQNLGIKEVGSEFCPLG